MLYNKEEYIKKLLIENELHDSEVIGIKLEKSYFQIDVSCKGMGLSYYFEKIEDIIMSIKIYNVSKLEFDFLNASILINSFKLNKNNNTIHIVINDNELIVAGDKMEIICKEIQKYEVNKKLDDYLKKN